MRLSGFGWPLDDCWLPQLLLLDSGFKDSPMGSESEQKKKQLPINYFSKSDESILNSLESSVTPKNTKHL
jgi:hypothetical protein